MSDTMAPTDVALAAGLVAVLDGLVDQAAKIGELTMTVAELRAELAELRGEVAPAIEAVAQLGPMAEKMASGGLMSLLRPG